MTKGAEKPTVSAPGFFFKFPGTPISLSECKEHVKTGRVVVISVFGKTALSQLADKASPTFDRLMKRDVFRLKFDAADDFGLSDPSPVVEGYFDKRNSRIYLHFSGSLDTVNLVDAILRDKESSSTTQNIHSLIAALRFADVKVLMFLFHVSHLIICHHQRPVFDLSYVRLFQVLDAVRTRMHPLIGDYLKEKCCDLGSSSEDLPKDVTSHGRVLSPRLVFYFASAPHVLLRTKGSGTSKNIRRLENALETQILRIMRRMQIINTSSVQSSLFALPTKDGFVYVNNPESASGDPLLDRIQEFYNSIQEDDKDKSQGFDFSSFSDGHERDSSSDEELSGSSLWSDYFDGPKSTTTSRNSPQRCFATFLSSHLEFLTRRGGGRGSSLEAEDKRIPQTHELPTASQWFSIASVLFDLFWGRSLSAELGQNAGGSFATNGGLQKANNVLVYQTSVENQFSEARCAKALPLAIASYKEGLQSHYLQAYHSSKLLQAMSLFSVQARGPAAKKYAELLVDECNSYWQSGRQMCEELSLTGNHCGNRKHNTTATSHSGAPMADRDHGRALHPEEPSKLAGKKILPIMPHQSTVTYLSACNCGRRQVPRRDPFTLIDANSTFYSEIEDDCCGDLEHINVPSYHKSVSSSSVLAGGSSSLRDINQAIESAAASSSRSAVDLLAATSGGPVGGPSEFLRRQRSEDDSNTRGIDEVLKESGNADKIQTMVAGMVSAAAAPQFLKKQTSQSSDLVIHHLLTTETPPGKLPAFTSWALTQLGTSSVYAHSCGLSQPGFVPHAKTLLPWDVPMNNTEWASIKASWPNIAESNLKKPGFNPAVGKGPEMRLTAKAFVGFEYECPWGHRFISPSAGKSMTSFITNRVLSSDVPLYAACVTCRTSNGGGPTVAQLMRVHIVTPKAPLHLAILPRVRPNSGQEIASEDTGEDVPVEVVGPTFLPGWGEPIKLPISTYWVLRLPFIYCGEEGVFSRPKDLRVPPTSAGRLLKGFITISEDYQPG